MLVAGCRFLLPHPILVTATLQGGAYLPFTDEKRETRGGPVCCPSTASWHVRPLWGFCWDLWLWNPHCLCSAVLPAPAESRGVGVGSLQGFQLILGVTLAVTDPLGEDILYLDP